MRPSKILKVEGYLVEYFEQFNLLNVNDTQEMIFRQNDDGTVYLSPNERQSTKYDRNTGKVKKVKYKLSELIKILKDEKQIEAKGNLKKIQQLARNNNIPLQHDVPVILEGWVGKPKGMLQILYERGFLDPTKINSYTLQGKKDEYGHTVKGTSHKEMMSSLVDFSEEETLLLYHGALLNVIVDRTPKCHPEIAGEGIEYDWAAAKQYYRLLRIKEKRRKQSFCKMLITARIDKKF